MKTKANIAFKPKMITQLQQIPPSLTQRQFAKRTPDGTVMTA